MEQFLNFALLGLGDGGLIAGLALAIVLTYRGSGIINLATGGIAMLSAYCYWALKHGEFGFKLGTAPGLIVTLVVTIAIGVLIEVGAFRPLRTSSPLAKLVSSLGILLIAQSTVMLAFGPSPQDQPTILPMNPVTIFKGQAPIIANRLILAGIVVAIGLALMAVYRYTRFGLATRAVSENEVNAQLAGLSANELSLANTVAASVLAGTVGVLAASISSLDSSSLPLLVIPALAAALLGRMTAFGVTLTAALLIGVLRSMLNWWSSLSWYPNIDGAPLPGIYHLLILLIIIGAMYLRGASLPGRGELVEQRLPEAPRANKLLAPGVAVGGLCVLGLIFLPADFRLALTNTMIGTVMALSLVVVTGFIGQISVVQLALAGAAGFTVSHLGHELGVPFPISPLIGVLIAIALGMLTAVSALRVRGVSLVVVTLAAAEALQNFGFQNTTWGGGTTGSPVDDAHIFGLNITPNSTFHILDDLPPSPLFGFCVLLVGIALCLLVASIRRGTLGQRMLAVRSNERAAAAAGINVRQVKLVAFGVAALIAGVAGSLYGYNFGSVSVDRFTTLVALSLIAFAYAGGITVVSGAVFAGLISTEGLLPHAMDKWLGINGNWFLLFGGVILLTTLIFQPAGAAGDMVLKIHARQRAKARAAVPATEGTQA